MHGIYGSTDDNLRHVRSDRPEIPLHMYHIPALIFAPGLVEAQHVEGITTQIDLMPPLFSLLGMEYDSHFYGRSIFDEGGDTFTILSPVCHVEQYRVEPTPENPHHLKPEETIAPEQQHRAISYYQTSSEWNKR